VPLLSIFFITLKPNDQFRIFNYLITILSIVYTIGLASYFLRIVGLNPQIGTVIATNPYKEPYSVFFGHIEESYLMVYRFSSIFDEPGVVGTLNGLILTSIGISKRDIRSLILLIAGLVSFSLAFYIILIINILLYYDFKKFIITLVFLFAMILFSGDKVRELIGSRLVIANGVLTGDNRTHDEFEVFYRSFLARGGDDLFFGKGYVTAETTPELTFVSNYKILIVRYGIFGVCLIICFYALFVYSFNNSRKGWFLFLIFLISAYQRPDLLQLFNIVLFIGGVWYLKQSYENS
jgi:hypothetical protein